MKIVNPATGEEVLEHPGIRLHTEYPVLSVLVEPGRGAKLRIPTSEGTPALFDAAMFATTDDTISPNWVARTREGGVVEFGPASWLEPGFWESYFDRQVSAVDVFESELRVIVGDTRA